MAYYQNLQSFIPYQHFTAVDMNFGSGSVELSHRISENFSMKDIALENFMASQQPAEVSPASSLTYACHPTTLHLERLDAVPVAHSISSSSTVSPESRKRKLKEQPERSSTVVTGLTGSSGITKKKNGSRKGKKSINIDKELAGNPEDVIHVRSRRGQATDSHSLSERVRREKINSKLRCLQEIVPGCGKKMGMALMLEEIINYVYSLQNQVEFLSMELAAAASTSTPYDSNMGTSTHGNGREQRQKTEKLQYGEHAYFHWTGSI